MSETASRYILEATLDYPKVLVNIIRSVNLKKNRATLEITEEGIKLISEEEKWLQTVAFLQKELFKQFDFSSDRECVSFDISLDMFLECLTLFGTSSTYSTVKMCYPGEGNCFVLFIEHGGVFSECELSTFQGEDFVDFTSIDDVKNRVIFKSELLKEIWAEMDCSSSLLRIAMDKEKFSLSTDTMKIEVGYDSEAVILFESSVSQEVKYNLKMLKATQKALNISDTASVRMGEDGTLSLQFLMNTECGHECYVEFFCRALEDFEDESALE